MSLQGLISGSECAVPSNPLAQVLKHTESDRSLQQVCTLDGTSQIQILSSLGSGSGRRTFVVSGKTVSSTSRILTETCLQLQHLPGSAPARAAQQDAEMARQFFGGPTPSSAPSLALTPPGPHAELSRLPEVSGRFNLNQAWAKGIPQLQQPVFRDTATGAPWASEFSGVLNQTIPGSSTQKPGQQNLEGMYLYLMFALVRCLRHSH